MRSVVASLLLPFLLLPLLSCRTALPPQAIEVRSRAVDVVEQRKVPGVSIALVRGGRVAWTGAFGFADLERRVPVTEETVFQVGSIAKPVAAWGILRLAESGRIDLDAPVERYLTRWRFPDSELDESAVTVRRLLSHTAGVSHRGVRPTATREADLLPLERFLSESRGLEGTEGVRLVVPPGTAWQYSGGGYAVLQLLAEEITGARFAEWMAAHVLEPLGMRRSAFSWRPDLRPSTATAYDETLRPLPHFLLTEQAAGGLYTTAPDLARWLAETARPGGRGVLQPATVASMLAPVAGAEGPLGRWGLGYQLVDLPDGRALAAHGGSNPGWTAWFALEPESGDGIVILTNREGAWPAIGEIYCAWAQEAFGLRPEFLCESQ